MDKTQKIVIFSGIGVVVVLIGVLVWLLFFKDSDSERSADPETPEYAMQQELDSLRMLNDRLRVDQLSHSLDSLPDFSEVGNVKLQADQQELVNKYNEARNKIETLLAELKNEKANSSKMQNRSKEEIAARDKKIAALEGQIDQLKNYCKDLLGRLQDLNAKYEEQVQINTQLSEANKVLEQTVGSTKAKNEELSAKVSNAQRLVLTGISLHAYNKKDKNEKKVSKARKLGVSFTVTANNAAAPGMKDFFVTIKTPEGQQLTGAGSFQAEGTTLQATARRQIEYANEEVSTAVYWDVNTSLTPGEYTVKIFCDGQCLATRRIAMN